jgi:hypothetical protein
MSESLVTSFENKNETRPVEFRQIDGSMRPQPILLGLWNYFAADSKNPRALGGQAQRPGFGPVTT